MTVTLLFFFSQASRKLSSDTSESECEPSSHPSRRSGVVAVGTPSSSGVFGLTEVSLADEERREVGISIVLHSIYVAVSRSTLKDDFQSVLRSLRTVMFVNIIRLTHWNANRCYSLRTTYLIFETFQILFPTASLIFTAVKLFHEVI